MPDEPKEMNWSSLPALISNVGVPAAMAIVILLLVLPKLDAILISMSGFHATVSADSATLKIATDDLKKSEAATTSVMEQIQRDYAASEGRAAEQREQMITELKRQQDLLQQCINSKRTVSIQEEAAH